MKGVIALLDGIGIEMDPDAGLDSLVHILVVPEGSEAQSNIQDLEDQFTSIIVAASLPAGLDEALSQLGIQEC